MIKLTKGDLLKARVAALVNTVNTEGYMGKGIALQFKKAFPDNFKAYAEACNVGQVTVGRMLVVPVNLLDSEVKYIINFPTKNKWRAKSKIAYIESGLVALVEEVKKLGIKSIAIPPLGCGLGGLPWYQVKELIENAFSTLPDVEVQLFEPGETPPAREMINNNPAPKLTSIRAAFLKMVERYMAHSFSVTVSLVEIQKLAYFLQLAGVPLKLNFEKDRYGPYAHDLRHVVSQFDGHYMSGFGDGTMPVLESNIELNADLNELDRMIESDPTLAGKLAKACEHISGFESAYAIELLASVHWAATHEVEPELNTVIKFVQRWSPRKGKLFTDHHISIAFKHLQQQGLIK